MYDNGGGGGGGGGNSTGSTDEPVAAASAAFVPAGVVACEDLAFTTILLSANAELLAILTPGQWLRVEYRLVDDSDTAVVVAPPSQAGERIVGALGSPQVTRLIQCLQEGEEFRARIMASSITQPCNVQIHHADRLPS